jgi:hypothetical protein
LVDLGRALFEKSGFSFDELGDDGQLEVEEEYQICVRRSSETGFFCKRSDKTRFLDTVSDLHYAYLQQSDVFQKE